MSEVHIHVHDNSNRVNHFILILFHYIYFILDFPDYDGEELNQISGLLARDYGYNYPPEARYATLYYVMLCRTTMRDVTQRYTILYYAMLRYSM